MGMTPELQVYYENRFDMFAHPGWKDLIEDVKQMVEATDSLNGVTLENLRYKQGELSMMQWLLSLKEMSEKAYESLQNPEIEQ
jgi:hypothetical protein